MNNDKNQSTPLDPAVDEPLGDAVPEILVTETDSNKANSQSGPVVPPPPSAEPGAAPSSTPFYKNKVVLVVLAVLFVVIIAATAFIVAIQQSVTKQGQPNSQQVGLLGAAITVIDGSAQYGIDNESWQDLTVDTELSEGTYVRTSEGSRVVVTLDDGSAVRINSTSTIRLASLDPENISIENVSGEVYTRVVTLERTFSVSVGDESYQALGTAYVTINKTDIKGVEVYQSEVSVKKANQKVVEGKRFYHESTSIDTKNTVTDIPLDQLQNSEFLKWNLEKDKSEDGFKDKLGYLKKLEETPVPTPAPAPKPAPTPAPSATSGITLSGAATSKGVSLNWKLVGISAPKGFKVVLSKDINPTFGIGEATYISDPNARNFEWKIKDGKTYYFRVCVYTGDGCTNYSNNVKITTPAYVAPAQPTGTLNLVHNGGNSFGWTLNGASPGGHKLVWSTSPGPTYGSSSAKYFNEGSNSNASIEAGSGSYYVRVCMYYSGGCTNYSNEVYVTLP